MKKNNYTQPQVEVFETNLNGAVCDFIPVSGEGEADVRPLNLDEENEEWNIWNDNEE